MSLTFRVCMSLLAAIAVATPLEIRQESLNTAVVNFGNNTGPPRHLASGTNYGLPDVVNQIPSNFFTDIGWNYERAGGAYTSGKGWIAGQDEYKQVLPVSTLWKRFESALANYKTTVAHGGTFILPLHDLWGADGKQPADAPYPGDSGSWQGWDDFLIALFSDLDQSSMTTNLVVDIWNEPDLGALFWGGKPEQYLDMWGRTVSTFRKKYGNKILISGPSSVGPPLATYQWWDTWAKFVVDNKVVPDQYSWHMKSGYGDMQTAHAGLVEIQRKHNLPVKPCNINEYGSHAEQVPAGSVWYLAQLERINALGLRANWLPENQKHDFMASLVSKPGNQDAGPYDAIGGGYYPNGDFQVYKYYNQMTGYRVGTAPSVDLKCDAYATVDGKNVKILFGSRITAGTWNLELRNLTLLGLPDAGSLKVKKLSFTVPSTNNYYGKVEDVNRLGEESFVYNMNKLSIPIQQNEATTAYAFEFTVV